MSRCYIVLTKVVISADKKKELLMKREKKFSTKKRVACVASVFVGLPEGLKHFSLFEGENWGERRSFHECCARPSFCATKKCKMPRMAGKTDRYVWYAG